MDLFLKILVIILAIIFIILFIFFVIGLIVHKMVYRRVDLDQNFAGNFAENHFPKEFTNKINDGMQFVLGLPMKEITIQSFDGLKLKGHYYDAGSNNLAILVHGYHSIYFYDFSAGSKSYYDNGYNLLFIEQRAHNGSEGKYTTFGVNERFDLQAWIKYIDELYHNKMNIVLCGISMGASTVMYTLGLDLPTSVKCAICDCGYTTPIDVLKHGVKSRVHIFYHTISFFVNIASLIRTKRDLTKLSTKDTLKNTHVPILIIHGTKDSVVPFTMGEKNATYNSHIEFHPFKDADHGMSYLVNPIEYKNIANDFLSKYMN